MNEYPRHLPAEERRAATVAAMIELAAQQNPGDISTTAIAQRMGLHVLEADDGETGLRLFFEHAPEISAIMLDLTMPGMNGAEVLAHIRHTHPHVPVIVMSGYDADDALATIGDDSAVTFLQKPFAPDVLRGRITNALRPHAA